MQWFRSQSRRPFGIATAGARAEDRRHSAESMSSNATLGGRLSKSSASCPCADDQLMAERHDRKRRTVASTSTREFLASSPFRAPHDGLHITHTLLDRATCSRGLDPFRQKHHSVTGHETKKALSPTTILGPSTTSARSLALLLCRESHLRVSCKQQGTIVHIPATSRVLQQDDGCRLWPTGCPRSKPRQQLVHLAWPRPSYLHAPSRGAAFPPNLPWAS